jgi:hypothetical protein
MVHTVPGIEIVDGITHSILSFQCQEIPAAVKWLVTPATGMEHVCAVHSELKHKK